MKIAISQIPIETLILMFIVYIIIHIGLGWINKTFIKKKENKELDLEGVNNAKIIEFLFKWWPAIYVILIIIILWSVK